MGDFDMGRVISVQSRPRGGGAPGRGGMHV